MGAALRLGRLAGHADAPALDALDDLAELHLFREIDELLRIGRLQRQRLGRAGQRRVGLERHQRLREARLLREVDERLPALRLLDFGGTFEQRLEAAILIDELGGRLDADPRHARHVVDAVAAERLDVDHLLRPDAEFLAHLGGTDRLRFQGIEHADAVVDELHQILVGGDDGDAGAALLKDARVCRDEVVGLVIGRLDPAEVEGLRRLAHQLELRHEIGGRLRPVRLVSFVEAVAEGPLGRVEDDGHAVGIALLHQLQQHVSEAVDGVGRRAVGAAEPGQRVEGAEDEAGAVDQIDMRQRWRRLRGGRGGRLRQVVQGFAGAAGGACSPPRASRGACAEGVSTTCPSTCPSAFSPARFDWWMKSREQ